MSALSDFKQFISDAESGSQYAKWVQQNPGEQARWQSFRDAILAGGSPPAPLMTTAHGRELADAGVMVIHYRALEQPPLPLFKVSISGLAQERQKLAAVVA